MYRFALRPAWLLSHVLVLLLIVVLAILGVWQVQRHGERQDQNALVEARLAEAPVSVEELLDDDPDDTEFRRVALTGSFIQGPSYLIDNRSLDGRPGAWVLSPFVLESGTSIVVNRGFSPYQDGLDVVLTSPISGVVELDGYLAEDAGRPCPVAQTDQDQVVGRSGCLEVEAVATSLGADAQGVDIRLGGPDDGSLAIRGFEPQPVPPPELGNGPHLGYAAQWFIFMAIAIVGYPLVLRRVARQHDAPDALDEELRDLLERDGRL